MALDWISAMDAVASAGIVNYDAPAAILGQPPRYYGHPDFEYAQSLSGPGKDVFDPKNDDPVKPANWKKKLLTGILTGVGLLASYKLLKGKLNMTTLKNFGSSVLNLVKKPFVWIKNLICKPSVPTP